MSRPSHYSLAELAKITGAELIGDPDHLISNVADLESATSSEASFLANPSYQQAMQESKAGVICIDSKVKRETGKNHLISDNPSRTFQTIIELFYPVRKQPSGFQGIHPTAVVHPSAQIGQNVVIGPSAVVDEDVSIGEGTFIGAGVYVGPQTVIGKQCVIHPRVVIRESCVVGNHVIIQPGAVIGSCGFGFTTDAKGQHTKLNQVGNVIIEDDVEIGANATVDRARFKSTIIGKGSKIDNQVQIAHGVVIGPCNLIAAQTGIAGSSSTGRCVVLGGHVAVSGHLHLSDGVMVAGKSGISKSLARGTYNGIPAVPIAEYNRNAVYLRKIETFVKELRELSKKINR